MASGGGGVGLGGRGTSRTVSPKEGVLQGAEGLYPARRRLKVSFRSRTSNILTTT